MTNASQTSCSHHHNYGPHLPLRAGHLPLHHLHCTFPMAPIASVSSNVMPITTPSKAVAASLDKFSFTPVKPASLASKPKYNSDPEPHAANDAPPVDNDLDPSRLRFVGDVDLDEKDEPLLKETQRRFVLFPIQYHEVRHIVCPSRVSMCRTDRPLLDMDDVQEGRSILLDSRRDGFV